MRFVSADKIEYQRFSAHRAGMSQNKRLLCGDPAAPDNFELSLVLSGADYATPRHRHNFDQIRYMISGAFKYGRHQTQTEGSVSYFAEGASYTQGAEGESVTLLLQFGGASGEGFLGYRDLDRGYHELSETGKFVDGVFTTTGANGRRVNRDAYEAIWEHVMGRPIVYPEPRYNDPVLMFPENYHWIGCADAPGVELKTCGRFTERDIGVGFIRLSAGAQLEISPRRICYTLSGAGDVDGQPWTANYAFVADSGKACRLRASERSELIFFDRPDFSPTAGRAT